MFTIAGGIILAILSLFALTFFASLVAQTFKRKHPYDPSFRMKNYLRTRGSDPTDHWS